MAWTTFANLTTATLPQLDGNFNILSGLTSIPCTVAGTNTLTLTNIAGAGAISAYANYQRFTGIAANTNSGAVTANFAGLGAFNVYKDTPAGPVALTGNEIVQNNAFTLIYDQALNGAVGGFHLQTGGSELVGQNLSIATLTTTGNISVASVGSIAGNIFGASNLSIASVASVGNLISAGYGSLGSLFVGSGQKVTRINTGSISLGSLSIANNAASIATVTVTGAAVND